FPTRRATSRLRCPTRRAACLLPSGCARPHGHPALLRRQSDRLRGQPPVSPAQNTKAAGAVIDAAEAQAGTVIVRHVTVMPHTGRMPMAADTRHDRVFPPQAEKFFAQLVVK